MHLISRVHNRILSWRNLKYLNFILANYSGQAEIVMEVGSCTGRLLRNFKRRGAFTYYNDLDIPEVKDAKRQLASIDGKPTEFLIGDFLKIAVPSRIDFIFSTGLFHTISAASQLQTLLKMSSISDSVFILIPDLSDKKFIETEAGSAPGRIGSKKYQLIDLPKILSVKYEYIQQGTIRGKNLGVSHDFKFYYGGSLKTDLESSRLSRLRYLFMNYFPIPPK